MDAEAVRELLLAAGEEIRGEDGSVIGYFHAHARFKLDMPYLGGGGFLVVERDEQTREFVAGEWDALWDGRHKRYYPSGYCDPGVWRTAHLAEAVRLVLAHLAPVGTAPETPPEAAGGD